ncbi:MAG TPA: DUF2809 domain-containing protein [Gemmatimonadaceae bacterium]|nr:DUF2809 domain-containing protein [Gemmatimonadaceae bacterium]
MSSPRDRRVYALLVVITVALGFASRKYGASLPPIVAAYAGDTLWAMAAFFTLAIFMERMSTTVVGVLALALSYFVEFSQLYRASWLVDVRATKIGAMFLGTGFLWSDIACYTAGVILACIVDYAARLGSR